MNEVTNTAVATVTAPPAQLSMFGVWDQKLGRAFDGVELTDKKTGLVNGARMKLKGKREAAKAYDLTGKDNAQALVKAIMEDRDAACLKAKAYISGLSNDHTLAKFETKKLASGVESIQVVFHKINRAAIGDTPDQIAAKLGLPVAEVIAMMAKKAAQDKPVDVTSTPGATVEIPAFQVS